MPLSDIDIDWFSKMITALFLSNSGNSFQNLVDEIFKRKYPGDYIAISGGGGDQKNDGLIRSRRLIFQCYSPELPSHTLPTLHKKITDDYLGAIKNWIDCFDRWVFIWGHYKNEGINSKTLKVFQELEKEHGIGIDLWTLTEIRDEALGIERFSLVAWLGSPPKNENYPDNYDIDLSDLQTIVSLLTNHKIFTEDDIHAVPIDKLKYNRFGNIVNGFIENGHKRHGKIARYFAKHNDPIAADKLAEKFKKMYLELQNPELDSDIIYWSLFNNVRHILGDSVSPNMELAIHSVLSFLFYRCDIFERPSRIQA